MNKRYSGYSLKDLPDEETAIQLNAMFDEEEPSQETWQKTPLSLGAKITAMVIIVIFLLVFSLGDIVKSISLSSMGFIKESKQLHNEAQVQELQQSTVRIQVIARSDSGLTRQEKLGTGFNIRPEGLIVTNYHVVKDAIEILVTFPKQVSFRTNKWYGDPKLDLAILSLEGENLPIVKLEQDHHPVKDEEVTIIGNPLGFSKIAVHGRIEGLANVNSITKPVMVIEAPIYSGSSGSPVFNQNGNVIGVVFATLRDSQDAEKDKGLAIPISYIRPLLKKLNQN